MSGIGALMQASPLAILGLFISGTLIGLGILIAWQNHNLGKVKKEIIKTTEETENEHFHNNQRKGALKIEYSNDYSFKSIGPIEGHGIAKGNLQTCRVAVHNTTEQDISGVQVWLEAITPMPPELMGHGAIPLHITHEGQGVNVITLRSHDKRYVDVVSFFDKFWNYKIRIEHTSAVVEREVFVGANGGEDDGYTIELVAKGDKV